MLSTVHSKNLRPEIVALVEQKGYAYLQAKKSTSLTMPTSMAFVRFSIFGRAVSRHETDRRFSGKDLR